MKTDYNKSMLRLGAVVVASASMLGASATMNAAPVAAPLYAADDAVDAAEIEENVANNQAAYDAYMAVVNDLRNEAKDAFSSENEYYNFLNSTDVKWVENEIEVLGNIGDNLWDQIKLGKESKFDRPIDEDAAKIREVIDKIRSEAGKAFNAYRIEKNQQAFDGYMGEIQALRNELAEATSPANEYASFLNRGLAESIANELDNLADDAEKYYMGVQEAGWFDLSIADDANSIRGAIEKLVNDALKAYNKDRQEKNAEAYGKYMTELSLLQEELTAVVNDPEIADFVNRGLAESIYNELETLYDEAEKYYQGVQEAGWFDLSIADEAVAFRGAIAKLRAQAEQAKENHRIVANEEAYAACMADVQALRNELGEATAVGVDWYDYINWGLAESINSEIDILAEEIEDEYNEVKADGVFALNISDSVNSIRGAIGSLIEKAEKAYNVVRVERNEEAYGKYMTELSLLQEELSYACLETNDYYPYINRGLAESIYNELETLYNEAEKYYQGVQEAGVFDLSIADDANAIRGAIAKLVNDAEKAMEKARVENNAEAYGKYMTELSLLQEELSAACGDESLEYYPYLNRGKVEAIYNELETLYHEAERYYMAVEEAGVFDLSVEDVANSIRGQINAVVEQAEIAYNNVRIANNLEAYNQYFGNIDRMREALAEATAEDNDYYQFINRGVAEGIAIEIDNLYDEGMMYWRGVEEAGVFDLNNDDDTAMILGQIAAMVEKAAKAYNDVRVANNEAAYTEYMDTIQALNDELAEATDEKNEYAKYLNRGKVESIANEIENLKNDGEREWLAVAEAGTFDLSIADDAAMIRGEIAKLVEQARAAMGIEDIQAYNDTAYGKDITKLTEMMEQLHGVWEEIGVNYPGYYNSLAGEEFAQAIYDGLAKKEAAATAEYEGLAEGEAYVSPLTDTFFDVFDTDLEELQYNAVQFEGNYKAMQADYNELNNLTNQYWEIFNALVQIEGDEWFMMDKYAAIDDQLYYPLNDMWQAISNAWQAYELDGGEYVQQMTPEVVAHFESLLNQLREIGNIELPDTSAVSAVEASEVAEFYTLDGQKSLAPIRGQVNIVRKGNKIQKIYVK